MRQLLFLLGIVLGCFGDSAVWGQPIRELRGHTAPVFAIAFRPDGERMASASSDHTIKV
jgi:WD40 repeat protein